MRRTRTDTDADGAADTLRAALRYHLVQAEQWAEYGDDEDNRVAEGGHRTHANRCHDALAVLVGADEAAETFTHAARYALARVHGA